MDYQYLETLKAIASAYKNLKYVSETYQKTSDFCNDSMLNLKREYINVYNQAVEHNSLPQIVNFYRKKIEIFDLPTNVDYDYRKTAKTIVMINQINKDLNGGIS